MTAAGFNPLRWSCSEKGCYNKTVRPRIEVFAECFPGRISMGDVDGMVEINYRFLMAEFKSPGGDITRGQEILFERLTNNNIDFTVFVLNGDPITMEISSHAVYFNNQVTRFVGEESGLEIVKERFVSWADWARGAEK